MSKKSSKTGNNLFHTLMELRGNPRACLFTEPMWGLSMNLCLPYMSVYMLARKSNITVLFLRPILSTIAPAKKEKIICENM